MDVSFLATPFSLIVDRSSSIRNVLERRLVDVKRYLEKCPEGQLFTHDDADKLQHQISELKSIERYATECYTSYCGNQIDPDLPDMARVPYTTWKSLSYEINSLSTYDCLGHFYASCWLYFSEIEDEPSCMGEMEKQLIQLIGKIRNIMPQVSELNKQLVEIHENHAHEIYDIIAYRGTTRQIMDEIHGVRFEEIKGPCQLNTWDLFE